MKLTPGILTLTLALAALATAAPADFEGGTQPQSPSRYRKSTAAAAERSAAMACRSQMEL